MATTSIAWEEDIKIPENTDGSGWAGLSWAGLGWAGWAGGRVGAVIQAEFELKLDTGLMWHTEQLSTETSARASQG